MNSYDEINAVRRSHLWEMRKSPAHYKYSVEHEEDPTPALLFGIAAHKYILETDKFWDDYILAPEVDRRTKAGKEAWAIHIDKLNETSKSGITITDYTEIEDMNAAILANETAVALLKTGRHEVPITWEDAKTGILCKCRPDCITEYNGEKYIVDYKTTQSCECGAFEKACRYYGYQLQAAMYTEGVFNETMEICKFAFVAQEKKPPYAVRVYFCDSGFIDEGMDLYRRLLDRVAECRNTGIWPGYEEGVLIGNE